MELSYKNRTIAEFMGAHPDMEYNASWDSIMQVVEKIEGVGYDFSINKNNVRVTKDGDSLNDSPISYSFVGINKDKITAVNDVCAEWIDWYNKKNN